MAEAERPSATGGETDTIEWSAGGGPGSGDGANPGGAPLLEPEEIDGLLRAGRDGAAATPR
jgi:hypothetical protein